MKFHRIALAAACAAAALAAQAQVARIQSAPISTSKPVNTQQAATFGMPRANGLNSPLPAGLTAGSGPNTGTTTTTSSAGSATTTAATATSPTSGQVVLQNPNTTVDPNTVTTPVVTAPVTTPIVVGAGTATGVGTGATTPSAAYAATAVMGAGSNIPAPRQGGSFGPGPYTAVEVAASFLNADANGDRELTRGEATRLALMPFSFEEMDRNHDGVVTRGEYDDSLR
ncbi:hypothetical protein [Ramlibacter albus]|uniref:EF-hand domain-containing protein n=1 Tax=Ramlibacter albus TaxID=2079448 RepID=A0A923S1L3_9BURK|nr:hypothetical protein [Ramlibacter albus]MBC5763808.1 hypothetical protein [Ramlibacter albus]